jgi:Domain of unknown function (DUF4116)
LKIDVEIVIRDVQVVLAAVKQNGYALQYATGKLKNDKDVVLAAVRQNGEALDYASDELKRDSDVINAASGNKISVPPSSTFFNSSAEDKDSISEDELNTHHKTNFSIEQI